MIPLRDVIPSRTTPYVNVGIIVLNALAWFFELSIPSNVLPRFVEVYGVVPAHFSLATVFTSMFLHGSWMHLIGNMWFFWLFGNNIEDSMGHVRFLVFYLTCGVAAAMSQTLADPSSIVPMVGASGAISGVMGAYLVLYPRVRVFTLVPIGFFLTSIALPAWVMLGYWMLLQVLGGAFGGGEGGVAFWAHVGGFVSGVILIRLFARGDYIAEHRSRKYRPRRSRTRRRGPWD